MESAASPSSNPPPVSGGFTCNVCCMHGIIMQCELYMCRIATNSWHLVCSDTLKDGGPTLIYDHQVCS